MLTLETAVCGHCTFRFCCKPRHGLCIFKHQCPNANAGSRLRGCSMDRRLSEPAMVIHGICDEDVAGMSEKEPGLHLLGLRSRGSSTSTTASSCATMFSEVGVTPSRSMTELTSFEFLSSIALSSSPASTSWSRSPRFDDTAWKAVDPAKSAHEFETPGVRRPGGLLPVWQFARPLLRFPDRPEWYCNARDCHSVFALFSQAANCSRCEGYFCSDHVDGRTKRCVECRRD